MADQPKRRVLVVGGLDKNIPNWIHRAFDIEHYKTETHFKKVIAPSERPDVVVALKSWLSHKQCADAKAFADEGEIPFILADGGWSMAAQRAAEQELDWFVHEIDKCLPEMGEEVRAEADEVVERAWESAYKRELEKSKHLERRYAKDRLKLDQVLIKLRASEERENAAERVIAEIREAARQNRENNEKTKAEVKKLANELWGKIDKFLKHHESLLENQMREVKDLRKHLFRLAEDQN